MVTIRTEDSTELASKLLELQLKKRIVWFEALDHVHSELARGFHDQDIEAHIKRNIKELQDSGECCDYVGHASFIFGILSKLRNAKLFDEMPSLGEWQELRQDPRKKAAFGIAMHEKFKDWVTIVQKHLDPDFQVVFGLETSSSFAVMEHLRKMKKNTQEVIEAEYESNKEIMIATRSEDPIALKVELNQSLQLNGAPDSNVYDTTSSTLDEDAKATQQLWQENQFQVSNPNELKTWHQTHEEYGFDGILPSFNLQLSSSQIAKRREQSNRKISPQQGDSGLASSAQPASSRTKLQEAAEWQQKNDTDADLSRQKDLCKIEILIIFSKQYNS